MNYMGIYTNDIANGDGLRVTLFVSGCTIGCEGCHNPEAQDFLAGHLFTEDIQAKLFKEIKRKEISGLTLTGGHPLDSKNLNAVEKLIYDFRMQFKNSKTIWLYTGYTWEYIKTKQRLWEICKHCDVVVDGPYEWWRKNEHLKFRGSDNQRIIDVQQTRKEKSIVLIPENQLYPVKPWRRAQNFDGMLMSRGVEVKNTTPIRNKD